MRRLTAIVTLTCTLLFLSSKLFAGGIDLTGVGARAQAMGGNYRAISDDWSALHWNTAGMAFTEGFTAGFSSELIKVNVGYTPAEIAGMQFSAIRTGETQNEPKTFFVPSAGAYYSNGKLAFGLGIWAPFGLGAKWDVINTSSYNSAFPEIDYDDDLQILNIQPSIAYKITDNLSVGLGVGVVLAEIMIQKPNFTPNPYVFESSLASFAKDLQPADVNGLAPQYNHLLTDSRLEGSGTGYMFNAGIMFKPIETLSIGASVQYYSDISLDGTVNAKAYFADNATAHQVVAEDIFPKLQALANLGLVELSAQELAVLQNFYSGATSDIAKDKSVTAIMPLPTRIGAGIAWSGIENLILSADVALSKWSIWEEIPINDEDGNEYSKLVENWEDGIRFGVGAEYNFGRFVGRGAWYTEPRAAIEETMTPSIPDFSRRQVVMGGIGLPLGPITLHASYEKILVGDKEVPDWNYDAASNGYHNLAGSYNMNINIVMFGMDYNF